MFNDWGRQKQIEMLDLWKTHFSHHLSGFELFTSPLRESASAVVVGYNAGGGDRDATELNSYMTRFMAENPDFGLPDRGHYEEGGRNYIVANKIRRYFFEGKRHLLPDAIETNRYFLRTEGKSHHKDVVGSVSKEAQAEYRQFCRETIRNLIIRSSPSVVLDFSGKYTASEFCEDLRFKYNCVDIHQHQDGKDFLAEVSIAKITEEPASAVISVKPHPSHPWLSDEHLEFFRNTVPLYLPEDSNSH
ncbi:hypothetical protein RBH26_09625 [Natronolimnohabitans sp. A-GB9]|uniref:hypothetical protein n=1 Tax=Natronolimnohabitans sp. A-GB9 TaxID=3069757 RepID=UPI0027B27875|nr:hypothetical protein [Natronolimnohabitans sp. A-GB9]MDQ2050745.1 hypothetical protein [Natronolimnohabitans sp. A-GB9]